MSTPSVNDDILFWRALFDRYVRQPIIIIGKPDGKVKRDDKWRLFLKMHKTVENIYVLRYIKNDGGLLWNCIKNWLRCAALRTMIW